MINLSLTPLLKAPWVIQTHTIAAISALLLGLAQFALPKGTGTHRVIGYAWAGLMIWIAGSSFWIHSIQQIGPWSWIHILSIVVLAYVPLGVWHAHRHRVVAHRQTMIGLFAFALIGAGAFTFLPGRIMHAVVFGG